MSGAWEALDPRTSPSEYLRQEERSSESSKKRSKKSKSIVAVKTFEAYIVMQAVQLEYEQVIRNKDFSRNHIVRYTS